MRLLSLVFALLLALAVVDAATRRRRPGRNPARRGRNPVGRRGRVQFRRRGRQDEDVEEVDLNAVEELDEAAADEEGSGEEEIYNGCDPATNIGGFLIAKNWKAKCVEKGYTDFGPYGGVPAEEEGSGEEEAADEPEEAAAEEAKVVEEGMVEVMEMEAEAMVAEENISKATVMDAEFGATRKLIAGTNLKMHICVPLITGPCRIKKLHGLTLKSYFRLQKWNLSKNSTVPK